MKNNSTLSLAFLLSSGWWRTASALAKNKAWYFFWPSVGLVFSNITAVLAEYWLDSGVDSVAGDLKMLLLFVLGILLLTFFGLFVGLWALSVWFTKLTEISACYLSAGACFSAADFTEQKQRVKEKRSYIRRTWLFSCLYLFVPASLLGVLIALQILANPRFLVFGQPILELPQWLVHLLWPGIIILSLFVMAYTFLLLSVSATFAFKPAAAAYVPVQACIKHFREIFLVTLVVVLLNIVITAPQLPLFSLFPVDKTSRLWIGIASQIWFGLTAPFVWTFSVLPYLHLVKSSGFSGNESQACATGDQGSLG